MWGFSFFSKEDKRVIIIIGSLVKIFCEKCCIETIKNEHINAHEIEKLLEYSLTLPGWLKGDYSSIGCDKQLYDVIVAGLSNASLVIKDPNFGEFIDAKNLADFLCVFAYHNKFISKYEPENVAEMLESIYKH